jgi:hypothetical protein
MERLELIGVDAKIARAQEHIAQFEMERAAFLEAMKFSVGYGYVPEDDMTVFVLGESPALPVKLSVILGDAVHCLRTALDHLANELVRWTGVTPGIVYFPIARSASEYPKLLQKQAIGVPDKAKKIFQQVNPYHGGNGLLWSIHELDRIDKHRLLVTVGTTVTQLKVKVDPKPKWMKMPMAGKPIKGEDVILALQGDHTARASEIDVEFEVAFGEPDELLGYAVVAGLNEMSDIVKKIVTKFR